MLEYSKLLIAVIVENRAEMKKQFNLFKYLVGNYEIKKELRSKDFCEIETSNVNIRFFIKNDYLRGIKVHYVLNLTQDEEYNNFIAVPMTVINRYLKDDPKWSMLFE